MPDGASLAYALLGSGPMLVAPPGWVSHLELQLADEPTSRFFEALARRHTLLLFDKRGTGLSDRERTDFSLDLEERDLEALLAQVAPGRLSMLGLSQGGPLAIQFAAAHPDRVEKLVLYGTFARGSEVAAAEVQRSIVALVRAHWGVGSKALAAIFFPDPREAPEAASSFAHLQRQAATPEVAARLLEQIYRTDVTALLPRVRCPALVLHRQDDRTIRPRLGRALAAQLPDAELVLLDGGVHLAWLGHWQAVVDPMLAFLEGPREARSLAPTRPSPESGRASFGEDRAPRGFVVEHRDLLGAAAAESVCRIGLAQVGTDPRALLSPRPDGLFGLPEQSLELVRLRLRELAEEAAARRVDLLLFPEMALDLNHAVLQSDLEALASRLGIIVVAGGFHDARTHTNLARVVGPGGTLWEQAKHHPASLILDGRRVVEPIRPGNGTVVVAETRVGRVAVAICRDFLDLDLRVALKNAEPPIDVVLNPAFTPVTADFAAAHFEARRSLYAHGFFCNVAAFGGSLVQSPEKRRRRLSLAAGREGLLLREVDLVALRAERSRWQRERAPLFIQSTR